MPRKPTLRVQFSLRQTEIKKSGKRGLGPVRHYVGKIDRRSLPPHFEYNTIDDVRRDQWIDQVTVIVDETKERFRLFRRLLVAEDE